MSLCRPSFRMNYCSEPELLEEVFNEEEMLIIHRAHLKMTHANMIGLFGHGMTPNLVCNEAIPRNEIMIVDDDEDTTMQSSILDREGSYVKANLKS